MKNQDEGRYSIPYKQYPKEGILAQIDKLFITGNPIKKAPDFKSGAFFIVCRLINKTTNPARN